MNFFDPFNRNDGTLMQKAMRLRSLAPAALFAVAAHTAVVTANAQDSRGDHVDGTYECVTGYRDVRDNNARPFYDALGITGTYADAPLAEIRVTRNGVSVSAHTDNRFKTVTIGKQGMSVVMTDADQQMQETTILQNGAVSATSQKWSPTNGPVGTIAPSQPLRPDEVEALSDRALNAIDRLCGPKFTS